MSLLYSMEENPLVQPILPETPKSHRKIIDELQRSAERYYQEMRRANKELQEALEELRRLETEAHAAAQSIQEKTRLSTLKRSLNT